MNNSGIVLLFFILIISSCSIKNQKKIFIVYSYHPDYKWVAEEDSGIMEVIGDHHYVIDRFYLDTKRHTDEQWMERVIKETLQKIEEFGPDIIIVCDDNACKMVAAKYIDTQLPVVFCGMNGDPKDYGFPTKNITGVIERAFYKESIEYLKELVPGIWETVIMLDSSVTARKSAENILKANIPEVTKVFMTNDYNKWKSKLIALQDSTDAIGLFVYSTLRDSLHSGPIDPEEVLQWFLNNNKLPEFAIMDFIIRGGALCGYCESGNAQGKLAAELAVKILEGVSPENIPIAAPPEGKRMINHERAKQLGIAIPD